MQIGRDALDNGFPCILCGQPAISTGIWIPKSNFDEEIILGMTYNLCPYCRESAKEHDYLYLEIEHKLFKLTKSMEN